MLARLCIAVGLIGAVLLVYSDVGGFGFVSLDDAKYVSGNPQVQEGLTVDGLRWAVTTDWTSNRIPLTWLSLMLDVELFGVNAPAHHWMNVGLHAANSVLLFLILASLTRRIWPSAFVAAVFAIHPLHVESVAWISERKDVLSGLFWLLALAAWARWVRRPGPVAYLAALLAFAAGLAAKPTVVTFPFALLLFDVWPLGRTARGIWPLVREKVPFFALSAIASVATAGVGAYFGGHSLAQRVANALVSYARYLGKTIWPFDLAVLYPHPGDWPSVVVAGAVILLLAVTGLGFALRKRAPHVWVGWLFFGGVLVPAIGILQVGRQAMADRYMYLPLIGLACMVAYSVPPKRHRLASVAALLALAGFGWAAHAQVAHWRSSEALFEHALAVTDDNWSIHYFHAQNLLRIGEHDRAIEHLQHTLRVRPLHSSAHHLLGRTRAAQGDEVAAFTSYERAVQTAPSNWPARLDLARALDASGKDARAAQEYRRVLTDNPRSTLARRALAWLLIGAGSGSEALTQFEQIRAELGYDDPVDLDGRAAAYALLGRLVEAIKTARRAAKVARDAGFEAQARKSEERARSWATPR